MNEIHGDRLKNERLRLGISQVDFIEAINASKTTVFNWERGETYPNSLQLEQMARLGMDVLYIITGVRQEDSTNDMDEYAYINVFDADNYSSQSSLYKHAFRQEWLKSHNLDASKLVVVRIMGDSMEPLLCHGEFVLVNRANKEPKTGRLLGVRVGSDFLVKLVAVQINRDINLKSKNPFYSDMVIPFGNVSNAEFEVVGEVVQSAKDFIGQY